MKLLLFVKIKHFATQFVACRLRAKVSKHLCGLVLGMESGERACVRGNRGAYSPWAKLCIDTVHINYI